MLLHPTREIRRRKGYRLLFRLEQEIGKDDNCPICNMHVSQLWACQTAGPRVCSMGQRLSAADTDENNRTLVNQ